MEFWLIWSLKTLKIIKEMWLNVFLKRFFLGGGDGGRVCFNLIKKGKITYSKLNFIQLLKYIWKAFTAVFFMLFFSKLVHFLFLSLLMEGMKWQIWFAFNYQISSWIQIWRFLKALYVF